MPPSRTATLASEALRERRNPMSAHSNTSSDRHRGHRHESPFPYTSYRSTPTYTRHSPLAANTRNQAVNNASNHAENIKRVLARSLAKRTATNYASATRAFTRFCDDNGFCPMPADEFTLCAYAASLASSMAGSSIANIFSGLKSWHNMHNATWNASPRLQLVIRGAYPMAPANSSQPQRAPVTIEMLQLLDKGLSRSDPVDVAVRAAAKVSYWAQLRLGEVLGSSKTKHDPSVLPSRSSLGPSVSPNGSRELFLPSTKTHQRSGERVIITAQRDPVNPIAALRAHLDLSRHLPDSAHLFAYVDKRTGDIRCLTKDCFLARCNEIWARNGIGRVTGHAFRIGGTTGLLRAGVPPEVVRSMGRWTSDAHFRYWRDTRNIAVAHAERIYWPGQGTRHAVPHPTRTATSRATRASPRLMGDRSRGAPHLV